MTVNGKSIYLLWTVRHRCFPCSRPKLVNGFQVFENGYLRFIFEKSFRMRHKRLVKLLVINAKNYWNWMKTTKHKVTKCTYRPMRFFVNSIFDFKIFQSKQLKFDWMKVNCGFEEDCETNLNGICVQNWFCKVIEHCWLPHEVWMNRIVRWAPL